MERVSIDTDSIRDLANRIDEYTKEYTVGMKRIKSIGNDLASVWKGEDYVAFKKKLEELLSNDGNVSVYLDNLNALKRYLNDCANAYDNYLFRVNESVRTIR